MLFSSGVQDPRCTPDEKKHSSGLQIRRMQIMIQGLKDKVIFITGASRGIGREIALRCARDGAKIAIAAKSSEPNPKLEGTIYSVAEEVEKAGGKGLPLIVDVRDETMVAEAVAK